MDKQWLIVMSLSRKGDKVRKLIPFSEILLDNNVNWNWNSCREFPGGWTISENQIKNFNYSIVLDSHQLDGPTAILHYCFIATDINSKTSVFVIYIQAYHQATALYFYSGLLHFLLNSASVGISTSDTSKEFRFLL